jgi:hypothetical protein
LNNPDGWDRKESSLVRLDFGKQQLFSARNDRLVLSINPRSTNSLSIGTTRCDPAAVVDFKPAPSRVREKKHTMKLAQVLRQSRRYLTEAVSGVQRDPRSPKRWSRMSPPVVAMPRAAPAGSCPLAWCSWRRVTSFAGQGRADQLAIAGRQTVGSSLNGAMVSSVM